MARVLDEGFWLVRLG